MIGIRIKDPQNDIHLNLIHYAGARPATDDNGCSNGVAVDCGLAQYVLVGWTMDQWDKFISGVLQQMQRQTKGGIQLLQ